MIDERLVGGMTAPKAVLDKDGGSMGQAVAIAEVGQSKSHGAILALRMRPAL